MTVRIGITIGDATSVAVCRTDGESEPTSFTSATVLAVDVDGTVLFADDVDVAGMQAARFATDFVGAIPRTDGFALADGQAVRPEDLMARAVWCTVESVHAMADDDRRTLVVTHPARWSRNSRNRLRDALDHVGLPEARLVSEADAAVNHLRVGGNGRVATAVVTADLDVVDIAVIGPGAEASPGPDPSAGAAASTRPTRGVTLRSAHFRGPEVVADLWKDAVERAGVVPRRLILTGVRGDDSALRECCARVSGLTPQVQPHLAARGAYAIADRLTGIADEPEPQVPEPLEPSAAGDPPTPSRTKRFLDRTPVVSGVTMLGLAAIAVGAMSTTSALSGQDRTGRESDFPTVTSSVLLPSPDPIHASSTPPPGPLDDAEGPAAPAVDPAGVSQPASDNTYAPPIVTAPPAATPQSAPSRSDSEPRAGTPPTAADGAGSPWALLPPLPTLPSGLLPLPGRPTTSTSTPTPTPEFGATSQSSPSTSQSSSPSAADDDDTEESESVRTPRNWGN